MQSCPYSCATFLSSSSAHPQSQTSQARMHGGSSETCTSTPSLSRSCSDLHCLCTVPNVPADNRLSSTLIHMFGPLRQNISKCSAAGTLHPRALCGAWQKPYLLWRTHCSWPGQVYFSFTLPKEQNCSGHTKIRASGIRSDTTKWLIVRGQTSSSAGCQLLTSFPSATSRSILLIS